MKPLIIILLFFSISLTTDAQKEANWCFFGHYAGLNFESGWPQPVLDSKINTLEGCSSISSPDGELMFYTDGMTVWNAEGNIMPNGTDLAGHPSSTQSGVVVPMPGNPDLFYIFTVDAVEGAGTGLRYSLVDMTLQNGLGEVVLSEKNVLMIPDQVEKITAVGNYSGDGTWLLTHVFGTNKIYAYLITSFGIDLSNPVVSIVGEIVPNSNDKNSRGYMKVSPDGTKICCAHLGMEMIQIFDFDNNTGIASNPIIDKRYDDQLPYGVEFSPDSKLLYVGSWYVWSQDPQLIYQYDLTAGTADEILESRNRIAFVNDLGALQLGPDNRIYIAVAGSEQLATINKPNNYGTACSFQLNSVGLGDHYSFSGLPPFITSFFNLNLNYYYEPACFGAATHFFENSSATPDSVLWNFGDPGSGANNWSKLSNPTHFFTASNFFIVKLKAWIAGHADSVSHIVVVGEIREIDLGVDTAFCHGDTLMLDAGAGFLEYYWQFEDSIGQYFPADTSGQYSVEVVNMQGCSGFDTINVTVNPVYYTFIDTSICANESIQIGGNTYTEPGIYLDSLQTYTLCDSVFEWQLNVKDTVNIYESITICEGDSALIGGIYYKTPGTYTNVYSGVNTCDSTVTTDLFVTDVLETFSSDAICESDSIFLCGAWRKNAGIFRDTTISQAGCDSIHEAELQIIPITNTDVQVTICDDETYYVGGDYQSDPGTYYDTLNSINFCDSVITTELFVNPTFEHYVDTMICEGTCIYLEGGDQYAPGLYEDIFPSIKGCDSLVYTTLTLDSLPRPFLGNDTTLQETNQLLLWVSFPGCTYEWQDGSTDSAFLVTREGIYWIKVSNPCGSVYDSISIKKIIIEYEHCKATAPNAFSPNGDNINDEFKLVSDCNYGEYLLQIYDRWGKMVFETTELDEGWDGNIEGKPAPIGTYVWRLLYREIYFLDGLENIQHGTVTLVR